ncbi:MAG: hypothetical protein ACE5KV_03190 [Thermoplasmata archaeon]
MGRNEMTVHIGGREFDGPVQIDEWNPPRKVAVYAIMMRQDPIRRPDSYLPLYFGQSENLSERGFLRSHHKFGCWIKEAGSTKNLFIAVHSMPHSAEAERRRFESQLISKYHPVCND